MTNFLLFIILFGVLVFIHEFGHFIIAKKGGVGVEKFFLGWGPKIFGIKRGETEYGINWIPLGGYVKLMGEETEDQKAGNVPPEKDFMKKSPWQRIAVVAAGPISNLILPIILFGALYVFGIPALGPVIGEVIKGSPAEKAGLFQGDRILSVGEEKIEKWDDLTGTIKKSEGKEISFEIEREGETREIDIKPRLSKVTNIYREVEDAWTVGITPYQYEPVIGIRNEDSIAYKSGLRSGDIIRKVNGKPVDYYWQFKNAIENFKDNSLYLVVERRKNINEAKNAQKLTFGISWDTKTYQGPNSIGIHQADLFIAEVKQNSIASQKGVKQGDVVKKIDGKKVNSWIDIEKKIQSNKGEEIAMTLLRGNREYKIKIIPKLTKEKEKLTGANKEERRLGIEPYLIMKDPIAFEVKEQTYNPFKAVYLGAAKTVLILKTQIIGFAKLIQGKLSVKHIGGPIMIYKFAGGSYAVGGIFSFVSAIALLSIVLGFINLLPIPILDGGHILFYSIEVIKRKPLSLRTREIAQQFGLVVIFGLLILATYNDIDRYFWSHLVKFFKSIF